MRIKINEILDFWFVETPDEKKFKKDLKFDQVIKNKFLNDYELAIQNKLDSWQDTARGCLALIILLDQFSRNLFRESGKAFDQASELLRNYINYKIVLTELEEPFSKQMDISALKQRNDYVKSLRRAQLGESAADIFFAQDEAYDDYMLERLAIQQNTTLSLDQRKQALARAEQDLPEKMQTMRKQVTVHADLSQNIKALRKEGASDNEIFQARSDVLGADAAVRLAQLDEKRALWQQRLDEYVSDRDQIKSSGLSKEDQHLALNNLLEQNFQGRDQLRVRALDANL